jgi:hypothetical protein
VDPTIDDLLYFVEAALDGMCAILLRLGDELANARLDVEGSNSPFVILTHCLGVMEKWGGRTIAGRGISRDRNAEFVAHGSVADLVARVGSAKLRFREDISGHDWAERVTNREEHYERNATVLLHVLEELAQHHGHMDITRDVLLARAEADRHISG